MDAQPFASASQPRTVAEVEAWLLGYMRAELRVQVERFQPNDNAASLGLDSLEMEQMAGAAEQWVGKRLELSAVLACETVHDFVNYLSLLSQGATAAAELAVSSQADDFARFVNPFLAKRLRQMRSDKRFVRGRGCYLEDDAGEKYLDFVAGYGALPFGHNPDEIWDAIAALRAREEPNLLQLAKNEPAAELAKRLVELTPETLRFVTLTNSGAEAVEAALKLCRIATGRLGVLTTSNSFHGKTLGALSATGNDDYQLGSGAPAADFVRIPYGDLKALEQALRLGPDYFACMILEPIQGEGGVVVPPPGYLKQAAEMCRRAGVLVIADEVQTGLGRTGELFASLADFTPDVLLLAKALSGGLVPIGACIASARAYSEGFALRHSSTFAGNALACRVALAALERITANDNALVRAAAEHGAYLRTGLVALQARFPETLREVRGRGLMLGLCIGRGKPGPMRSFLDIAFEQGLAAPFVASFLLNAERVRVVPTLNASHVLRVQPPLIVTRAECDQFLAALERALTTLESGDANAIVRGLLHQERVAIRPPRQVEEPAVERQPVRFGFLVHPLTPEDFRTLDEGARELADEDLRELSDLVSEVLDPFVAGQVRVEAADGRVALGDLVVVPRTGRQLLGVSEAEAGRQIGAAVDLCVARGAQIVGLGGYTAVASRGGQLVLRDRCGITTGNAYTAVVACEAIDLALRERGQVWNELNVAVVGAAGSVGRAMCAMLAERCGRLLLVGNPKRDAAATLEKLTQAAIASVRHLLAQKPPAESNRSGFWTALARLPNLPDADAPESVLREVVAELGKRGVLVLSARPQNLLAFANVVMIATSAPEILFELNEFRRDAIVCDVSRPGNVSPAMAAQRPDVLMLDGGLVRAPRAQGLTRFGLGEDLMYACMAETILLALDGQTQNFSIGVQISSEQVAEIRRLAARSGFRVGELQSFGKPLPHARTVRAAE